MFGKLEAVPVTLETASQVFPLARSLVPELELDGWLAFARRQIERPETAGIVGVRDERGYFHGLFNYEVRHDVRTGPILDVGMAMAVNLLDRAGAGAVLVRAIDAMAVALGCAGTQIRLTAEQRQLRRWLEGEGHALRCVVLEKAIAAAITN